MSDFPQGHLKGIWVQVGFVPAVVQRGMELKTLEEKISQVEMQAQPWFLPREKLQT